MTKRERDCHGYLQSLAMTVWGVRKIVRGLSEDGKNSTIIRL